MCTSTLWPDSVECVSKIKSILSTTSHAMYVFYISGSRKWDAMAAALYVY